MKLIFRGKEAIIELPEGHFLDSFDEFDLQTIDENIDFSGIIDYFLLGASKDSANNVINLMDMLDLLRCNREILSYATGPITNINIANEMLKYFGTYNFLRLIALGKITANVHEGLIIDATDKRINDVLLGKCIGKLKIKSLDISYNTSIVNIYGNEMEELCARNSSVFLPEDIRIKKLNASDSQNITILPSGIEELDISYSSGITDRELSKATSLKVLNISNNPTITIVPPSVEILYANAYSGIYDQNLSMVKNIRVLSIAHNHNIKKIPHTVEELNIDFTNINDSALSKAVCLRKLSVRFTNYITTVQHFADTLEELDASRSNINDLSLEKAKNLKKLNASDNSKITTIEPFADSLEELDASGFSGIGDAGLSMAKSLKKLDLSGNMKITTVEPFANTLEELVARGQSCAITRENLSCLVNLRTLRILGNPMLST